MYFWQVQHCDEFLEHLTLMSVIWSELEITHVLAMIKHVLHVVNFTSGEYIQSVLLSLIVSYLFQNLKSFEIEYGLRHNLQKFMMWKIWISNGNDLLHATS